MNRRRFLLTSLAGAVAAPLAVEAQKSQKIAHVGVLGVGPTPSPEELAKSMSTNPLWISMRQLGWVDGQNMVVERRFGDTADELRAGAADLVRLNVDVLFVGGASLAKMLQLETKTIPIVVAAASGARAAGTPWVMMTSTLRRTSSAASAGRRSYLPSAHRYSIVMFFPSTYPWSRSPRRNSSTRAPYPGAEAPPRNPIR